ncbi:MAG: hypothetical protein U0V56_06075 [Actinomycetota bacterium]
MSLVLDGGSSPGWLVPLGILTTFGWLFGILPSLFLLPLLFPDGKLPSPRWRPYLWLIFGFLAFLALALVFGARTLTGSGDEAVPNPLYVEAVGSLPSLDPVIAVLFPAMVLTSIGSMIGRFRRSSGVERQQIKWVTYGMVVAVVCVTLSGSDDTLPSAIIGGIGFMVFPLSIGVAVLRFHLYDLDVVVRKTVVYAAIALFAIRRLPGAGRGAGDLARPVAARS